MMMRIASILTNPLTRSDGRPERHDRGRAELLQSLCQDRVGANIGQHGEAFRNENLARLICFDRVGQEVFRIGNDLQFDPVGKLQRARHARYANCFFGGLAAGGVGQNRVGLPIDVLENRSALRIIEIDSSQGNGDDLRLRRAECGVHLLGGPVFSVRASVDCEALAIDRHLSSWLELPLESNDIVCSL